MHLVGFVIVPLTLALFAYYYVSTMCVVRANTLFAVLLIVALQSEASPESSSGFECMSCHTYAQQVPLDE